MQLPISYFKRFKMEVDLADLPAPCWPDGYRPVEWRPDLLDAHAEVLCRCFVGEIDSTVFPSLGSVYGCRGLMAEIARRSPAFARATTSIIVSPDASTIDRAVAGENSCPRYRTIVARSDAYASRQPLPPQ